MLHSVDGFEDVKSQDDHSNHSTDTSTAAFCAVMDAFAQMARARTVFGGPTGQKLSTRFKQFCDYLKAVDVIEKVGSDDATAAFRKRRCLSTALLSSRVPPRRGYSSRAGHG